MILNIYIFLKLEHDYDHEKYIHKILLRYDFKYGGRIIKHDNILMDFFILI